MQLYDSVERQKIRFLLNHISGYSDIIRNDAILLKKNKLAEYFRQIISESAEIKRIVIQAFPENPDDEILSHVVREEVARHLYVITYLLAQLKKDLPREEYREFDYELTVIRGAVAELVLYFEKLLDISTDRLSGMSLADLQGAADAKLSEYLTGISVSGDTIDSGAVLFTGCATAGSIRMYELLDEAGYRMIMLDSAAELTSALSTYEVSLICVDDAETGPAQKIVSSLKNDPLFHDMAVLVCGEKRDDSLYLLYIRLGAVDYFTPEQNSEIVLARVQGAVAVSKGNYRRQLYIRALEINKYSVSKEFSSAAAYVSALLPKPFKTSSLKVDWVFLPSLELGGDIFGYTWLSPSEFVVYLLDVSGHGLEASLFSVTVMNLLSKQLLKKADFRDPASVLTELNSIFHIEEQNNMYFTVWYGVYDTEKRLLTYSSAGSQPAVLYPPESPAERLSSDGLIIGIDQDTVYTNNVRFIAPGAHLYVFSDGIFEIRKNNGVMMTLDEFVQILGVRDSEGESCRSFARRVESMSKTGQFDDDVSMIELSFFD